MAKRGLRSFLRRGFVASEGFITTGASAVSAAAASGPSLSPFHVRVRTGGTAGNEVLNLPLNGDYIGQRLLVTFAAEGNAADVVRIQAAATGLIVQQAVTGDAAQATVATAVDLDTPGEYALFEYVGQASPAWNVVYTTGALV
jgi:hypothetical protein